MPLSDEYNLAEVLYNATGFFDIRLEVREKSRISVMFLMSLFLKFLEV